MMHRSRIIPLPALLVPVFMVLAAPVVTAHPHIWIDSRVEIELEGTRINTVRAHWTFDPFFSQMIIVDYGRPRNGRFSDDQIEAIRRGAFENLRHFDYFTMIRVDDREIPVERVDKFHAYLDEDGALVYQFDVPLNIEVQGRSVAIAMYDETFFTDMVFRDDYVSVRGGNTLRYRTDLRREVFQVPIWGPMNRETVVVEFERRG